MHVISKQTYLPIPQEEFYFAALDSGFKVVNSSQIGKCDFEHLGHFGW